MPPTRNRFYFRPYYRTAAARKIQRFLRRRRKNRRYRNPRLSTQVKRLKQKVYNNEDKRWKDTIQSNLAADANGNVFSNFCGLELIPQGDAPDQRSGNQIVLKQIKLKGQIRIADGDAFNSFRMVIFTLRDTPVSPPLTDSILQTGELYSFYKKNGSSVFSIDYDKTWTLGSLKTQITTTTGPIDINQGALPAFRNFNIVLNYKKGKKIWYRGSTAGTPIKNSMYMILLSDSTEGLITGHPTLSMNTRIKWLA